MKTREKSLFVMDFSSSSLQLYMDSLRDDLCASPRHLVVLFVLFPSSSIITFSHSVRLLRLLCW